MSLSLERGPDPSKVGFDAGWKLTFYKSSNGNPNSEKKLEVSRSQYYGEIKLDTAASFRAGKFEIKIDGLTDEDYQKITNREEPYVFLKIEMGWRDLGSGFLAGFSPLATMVGFEPAEEYIEVMEGRIQEVTRVTGEFLYRTEIRGIERTFHRLSCTHPDPKKPEMPKGGMKVHQYAEALANQAGVGVVSHTGGGGGRMIKGRIEIDPKKSLVEALKTLARKAHPYGDDREIPMFLRGGKLHFGPWVAPADKEEKAGPADEGGKGIHKLSLATGLVEAKPIGPQSKAECDLKPGEKPKPEPKPQDLEYDLTLLGRPDILVGDKVEMHVDKVDLGKTLPESVLGGWGDIGSAVEDLFRSSPAPELSDFRVAAVKHVLDRSQGFATFLRVEPQPPPDAETEKTSAAKARQQDEEEKIAARLRDLRTEVLGDMVNIGEVREQRVKRDDQKELFPQRVWVQEGLEPQEPPNRPVRAKRAESPLHLEHKPYLTPFAFGKAGLVIPHYPGMRVAMLHYQGEPADAMVAGCLWDENNEPQKGELGDWWLCLPTNVQTAESVADSGGAEDPKGKGSHDLIDKDGKRVINVRGFRITIGERLMKDIGERPQTGGPEELEILYEKGSGDSPAKKACIKIDSDGNIEISTSGTLKLKANNVEVDVAASMEVK